MKKKIIIVSVLIGVLLVLLRPYMEMYEYNLIGSIALKDSEYEDLNKSAIRVYEYVNQQLAKDDTYSDIIDRYFPGGLRELQEGDRVSTVKDYISASLDKKSNTITITLREDIPREGEYFLNFFLHNIKRYIKYQCGISSDVTFNMNSSKNTIDYLRLFIIWVVTTICICVGFQWRKENSEGKETSI